MTASAESDSAVAASSCDDLPDSELAGFPAYDQTGITVRARASARPQS